MPVHDCIRRCIDRESCTALVNEGSCQLYNDSNSDTLKDVSRIRRVWTRHKCKCISLRNH